MIKRNEWPEELTNIDTFIRYTFTKAPVCGTEAYYTNNQTGFTAIIHVDQIGVDFKLASSSFSLEPVAKVEPPKIEAAANPKPIQDDYENSGYAIDTSNFDWEGGFWD